MRTSKLREALSFFIRLDFWRLALLWTLSLVFSYLQVLMLPWRFSSDSRPIYRRCSVPISSSFRPLCIITGATSGLGAAAAYALAEEGFYVVLVGRSSQLLSKTVTDIKTRNENAHLKAFQVDLSSFVSISKFKASLEQWLLSSGMHSSVQLLINNAGILATSHRLTAQGYDETMATNYIGPFYLTKLLLPLLKSSPTSSRIVNVTSFTHRNVDARSKITVGDCQLGFQYGGLPHYLTASIAEANKDNVTGNLFSKSRQYPFARVYEYSKLCVLLFSYELHRQLGLNNESRRVSVIAADPGVVDTNITREIPACIWHLALLVLKLIGLLQSPESGVRSIIDAALAPPEISGVYFFGGNGRTIKSSELSYNARLAQQLWTTSSDLILQTQLDIKEH